MSDQFSNCYTYYEEPNSNNSQFISQSFKTFPLRDIQNSTNEAIFPMKELDLKLFYLIQDYKNSKDYNNQKQEIPNLNEKYHQFYYSNILDHKRNFFKYSSIFNDLKKQSDAYLYKLTKEYMNKYNNHENVIIPKIDKISQLYKNDAEINEEKLLHEQELKFQKEEEEAVQKSLNQSSRGNVIVDESQLEELMAKLDPLNKYRQVAVNSIPEMFHDPIDQYITQNYQNYNSVTLNKQKWAELTTNDLKSNLHPFNEEEERQFFDAFMLYPKEFGKICKYMKYKRTIPELIKYYYHTKLQNKYFDKYLKMKEDLEKEKELKKQKKKNLKQQMKLGSPSGTPSTPVVITKKKIIDDNADIKDVKALSKKLGDQIKDEVLKPITQEVVKEPPKEEVIEEPTKEEVIKEPTKEEVIKEPTKNENVEQLKDVPIKRDESSKVIEVVKDQPHLNIKPAQDSPKMEANQSSETKPLVLNNEQSLAKKRKLSSEMSSESEGPSGKKLSSGKTSYWSVHEAGLFPGLLRRHGKDWKAISDDIKTKSVTMIRNYYLKKGKELGFETYVLEHEKLKAEGKLDEQPISSIARVKATVESNIIPNSKVNLNSNLLGRQILPNNTGNQHSPPSLEKRGPSTVLPPLSQHFAGSTALNGQYMKQTLPPPIKPTLELFPNNGSNMNMPGFKSIANGHRLPPLTFKGGIGYNHQEASSKHIGPTLPPISYTNRTPGTSFPMTSMQQTTKKVQYQYIKTPTTAEREGQPEFMTKPLGSSTYSRPTTKGGFIDPLSALAAIASNEQKLMESKEDENK
ncbi:uncharacterized protein HGUI_01172 [Hanseniaspora guilliermondii]|uniref:SANT domain-containing protein n=1 Tax=Hanseniaspora guilliermondii TaxID=56406 RepID=A0A1L0AZL2_9ASCO|nr:uncharacterized protein HGUI_01172 [Hanseniaspora guilliermondii]